MKQILIICLLVLAIAARHHQADSADVCMDKHCRPQTQLCLKFKNCMQVLNACAETLSKDFDFVKYDNCVKKVPPAKAASDCLFQYCLFDETPEAIHKLLNRMD